MRQCPDESHPLAPAPGGPASPNKHACIIRPDGQKLCAKPLDASNKTSHSTEINRLLAMIRHIGRAVLPKPLFQPVLLSLSRKWWWMVHFRQMSDSGLPACCKTARHLRQTRQNRRAGLGINPPAKLNLRISTSPDSPSANGRTLRTAPIMCSKSDKFVQIVYKRRSKNTFSARSRGQENTPPLLLWSRRCTAAKMM